MGRSIQGPGTPREALTKNSACGSERRRTSLSLVSLLASAASLCISPPYPSHRASRQALHAAALPSAKVAPCTCPVVWVHNASRRVWSRARARRERCALPGMWGAQRGPPEACTAPDLAPPDAALEGSTLGGSGGRGGPTLRDSGPRGPLARPSYARGGIPGCHNGRARSISRVSIARAVYEAEVLSKRSSERTDRKYWGSYSGTI